MLNALRRFSIFASPTALILLVLTSWKAPDLLAWWSTSPVPLPIQCDASIKWAAKGIVEMQIGSLLLGLVLGGVLALVTRKKVTASLGPPAAAPGAAASASPAASEKK